MAKHFAKIAVLGRPQDPRVTEPIAMLARHLTDAGREVLVADDLPIDLPGTRVEEPGLAGRVELMIAVGGDGTMLYAAHLAMRENVPVFAPRSHSSWGRNSEVCFSTNLFFAS